MSQKNEISFLAYFGEGYTLRNTFSIVKGQTREATMILTPEAIEISFINADKSATHEIILDAKEFNSYYYEFRDENNNLADEYPITFNVDVMCNTLKNIGRSDGVRFYMFKGDDRINVQSMKLSSKDPNRSGAMLINTINREITRYVVPDNYPDVPNVKIPSKELNDVFARAVHTKCKHVRFVGYNHSARLESISVLNTVSFYENFNGNVNITDTDSFNYDLTAIKNEINTIPDNIPTIKIPINIISRDQVVEVNIPHHVVKSLVKIHNISPKGTMINFYFSQKMPIKMESPIGMYGVYRIWLSNKASAQVLH